MSLKKPEPEPPLREVIREHWSDKLKLGGSKDGHVACYAANQVLGTVWRGSNENADTKEVRDPPAYGSSRHRFAGRGLQGGEGWTRTLGRAWARRSAPTTLAQAGPRPSADGGCRRAASRTRC